MLSEIGSNFWLNPDEVYKKESLESPTQFNCSGNDYIWLSTGRSAIKMALRTIKNRHPSIRKTAILPSFTCDTVIQPFVEEGFEVYYYPVNNRLRTKTTEILQTVKDHNASVVLFHRYFGTDTLDGPVDEMCDILNQTGKYVIEDCTQNLYSQIHRSKADYFVGSIRKWTGTPDGGFIVCRDGCFFDKPKVADIELEQAKIEASYAKFDYIFHNKGNKDRMLALYRYAENLLDQRSELYSISQISAKVQTNLHYDELCNKRRKNFNQLLDGLKDYFNLLFNSLDNGDVPLYFPIFVDDRKSLQTFLVHNRIYAPVVWPKEDHQPAQCEGAEFAYKHLLCIPIDQRYNEDDMDRVLQVLRTYNDNN